MVVHVWVTTAPWVRLRSGFVLSYFVPKGQPVTGCERHFLMIQRRYFLMVWIALAFCAMNFRSQAQLPVPAPEVKVHIERSGERWLVWFWRPVIGQWTIQANRTGFKEGWFTPPSYVDDGIRIKCEVPNTPMMIFRAWRVR